MKCNQSLHCQYHQERRHTTENCRTLWNHLEQLVKKGKFKQFLYQLNGQGSQARLGTQRDAYSRLPLGTISVILAAPARTGSFPSKVMSIDHPFAEDSTPDLKRSKMHVQPALSFSSKDKVRTSQPHDDSLVVSLRIGGYDVKRVLVDQGSGAKIMYPDLYKGLRLRPKDLTCYDSPLVGFDGFNGTTVIPKGQIRLPVQVGSKVVEVDFIVVNAYSSYTIIEARLWLHAIRAVSFTLHLKVKYPFGNQV